MSPREWSPAWARVGDLQRAQVLTFQHGEPFVYDSVIRIGDKAVEWCVGTCTASHAGGTVWEIDGSSHACMAEGSVRIPPKAGANGALQIAELLAATMIRNLLDSIGVVEGSVRWANIPAADMVVH